MGIVNKHISLVMILLLSSSLLASCSSASGSDGAGTEETEDEASPRITDVKINDEETPATFSFATAQGEYMDAYLQESVERNPYNRTLFLWNEGQVSYDDDTYTSRWGVDVCSHNGKIDWEEVKKAGASFAFVRVGYRGYGKEGTLHTDEYALDNIDSAQKAGLDVGVYFFSQAVNEEEALEEADLTLEILDGRTLELPVVFDPEDILEEEARTDTVSGDQFTENTIAFCDRIREAGYEPMIYCNMMWEAYTLDLTQLTDLDIWYADYQVEPQTPYRFTFWQYSDSGQVPGITGDADLDLQFIQVENE